MSELSDLILFARCLLKVACYTGLILGLALAVVTEVLFSDFLTHGKERH